jgi:CsoR family transcriptional regulator, copper-sensing transcriptional repressor
MHDQAPSVGTREDTEAILTRLRRIEGQIRGIHRMLEEDRVCEDVVTQLMAARSSLDQVGLRIIDHHIDRCLISDNSSEEALRNLRQALRMWLRFGGPTQATE